MGGTKLTSELVTPALVYSYLTLKKHVVPITENFPSEVTIDVGAVPTHVGDTEKLNHPGYP